MTIRGKNEGGLSQGAGVQGRPAATGQPVVLTINGGSSSIKFALYRAGGPAACLLRGAVERIGQPGATLEIAASAGQEPVRVQFSATSHTQAALALVEHLRPRLDHWSIAAVGHRVVHGGGHRLTHQWVDDDLLAELRTITHLDLTHLPGQIALIEALRQAFPQAPHAACFDTAFHRDLPAVAQLLPIPRRCLDAGMRRLGFHGLSFAYLRQQLTSLPGPPAAGAKVILAHLGAGASLAALRDGLPIDTTMAFTPSAGLVMGTRPGDLDPGLLLHLMRQENRSLEEMEHLISYECGLLGVSGSSSDMRDLLAKRSGDPRAAQAVELFCMSARKWIGALSAALGGLDTLVFSGGIGERAAVVRWEICQGLSFLGLHLDEQANAEHAAVISTAGSTVTVRVIATDEQQMIAQATCLLLGLPERA